MASMNGRTEAVRWLLQNGADSKIECVQGYNPKQEAVDRKYEEIVKLLD